LYLIPFSRIWQDRKQRTSRASAFTFSASKISLTAVCFEEKIYREVEEGEEGRKKGPESKHLFDCEPSVRFDLAVKILLKPGGFPEYKSKRRYPERTGNRGRRES
jgi:hypothetical protein